MKIVKKSFCFIIYFVVGNLLFNTIFSITKVFVLNNIGAHESYFDNWLRSFKETFMVFVVMYLIFIIAMIIRQKITINQLNNKLQNIKGRRANDEK